MSFAQYFHDELTYLRSSGRAFAQAFPALAPMLAEHGGDPEVERLLEGLAYLTGAGHLAAGAAEPCLERRADHRCAPYFLTAIFLP